MQEHKAKTTSPVVFRIMRIETLYLMTFFHISITVAMHTSISIKMQRYSSNLPNSTCFLNVSTFFIFLCLFLCLAFVKLILVNKMQWEAKPQGGNSILSSNFMRNRIVKGQTNKHFKRDHKNI